MKPGSLAICIEDGKTEAGHQIFKDVVYTIRQFGWLYDLYPCTAGWFVNALVVQLEEVGGTWCADCFREIEFPPALEQEIKELISEPVEL